MKCQHHRYTVYLPMCCMHTHSSDKKSKKEQDSSHHHYQESVFKPSQMILLRLRMHSLGFSQNNLVGYLQRKKKKKKNKAEDWLPWCYQLQLDFLSGSKFITTNLKETALRWHMSSSSLLSNLSYILYFSLCGNCA